ncbi:MAG: hypothetical protein MZV63_47540 [Marinilabiliales bacterium]|nr:hypothetical protein [Marinilabiliales bacterium]
MSRSAEGGCLLPGNQDCPSIITPHAVYSVSEPLWALIRQHISPESVISLHFLESDDERKMAQGIMSGQPSDCHESDLTADTGSQHRHHT